MPEFVLDLGNKHADFGKLSQFTQGYVTAAFWTNEGEPDEPCNGASFDNLAPETLERMEQDCTEFNMAADAWLHKAYLHNERYEMYQDGIDLWLSRKDHGAGF